MPTPLSVVMPAYRLESVIGPNIRRVAQAISGVPGSEIIVVDDGSDDGTFAEASAIAAALPNVHVLRHDANRGKGAALRTGALTAVNPLVVLLDGDLDLPPEQIPNLVETLQERKADVLVGAKRYGMSGGRYPLKRRILSRVFRFVTRVLFRLPIDETQTGLKIFRREALASTLPDLTVTRYAFDLELLLRVHRAGFEIIEVPVTLEVGASSAPLSIATLWEMGRDTMRILWWSVTHRHPPAR